MGLYYDCPELDAHEFNQFFIDQRFQERGLGLAGAKLLLEEMRREGKYQKVILCCIQGNAAARGLYEKLGFAHTGRQCGDEIVTEKRL